MSQRALLLAVRDYLRQYMNLAEAECEVMFDGEPSPGCGERFVSVHAGQWLGIDSEGNEQELGVQVTVTRRCDYSPMDRVGVNALVGPDGAALDKMLEAVIAAMHLDAQQDKILNLANAIIGNAANGLVEPLRFRDGGRPEPKGPTWFNADADSDLSGIAQTVTFGGAKRVQTIESAT